jgi:hypothetical protein
MADCSRRRPPRVRLGESVEHLEQPFVLTVGPDTARLLDATTLSDPEDINHTASTEQLAVRFRAA